MRRTGPDRAAVKQYVELALGAGVLATRVTEVMARLPHDVVWEFLDDPLFRLALDDYQPGRGRTVWMACPSATNGSRCVVLKPRLGECGEAFAQYIIAHELAHAHLRNGGWGDVDDPERAADALAAHWGFARVDRLGA